MPKVLALVGGQLTEVDGGGALAEYDTDPVSPAAGEAWVLRTVLNPAGTLQAMIGGFPAVTQADDSKFQLSINTTLGTRRVTLT